MHCYIVTKLTPMESNAVRYMAGYVALKLLKQFKKSSQNPRIEEKRKLFVKVLQSMKAENQPGELESVLDYTTLWAELIGRGGLYHINDQVIIKSLLIHALFTCFFAMIVMQVYQLMESIELVCRQHLDVENVHVLCTGMNLRKLISDDVLKSELVLGCWEVVAQNISTKYERYSFELLQHITDVWITIRGHSFAK